MRSLYLLALILGASFLPGCAEPVDVSVLGNRIEAIASSQPDAIVAVSVRVPGRGITFDREGGRLFHAASTMKIPVMIEVFRQAGMGTFSLDDSLLVQNRFRSIVDGSEFAIGDDSDDDIYTRLGSRMAIRDLIESMITVSSNLATNLLIDFVGAESVQATSERLGTTQMLTLRGVEDLKAFEQGLSNRATSEDLAALLAALVDGRAVSTADDEAMLDVLARQEFNEMIPAGLPDGVRVAHKTGQITAVHHDAAAVFPENRDPYILVILTEGLADDTESAALGARIASAVDAFLREN